MLSRQYGAQPCIAFMGNFLKQMFGKNAAATELGAFLHQFADGGLSFRVNGGRVGQINHELTIAKRLARIAPLSTQFGNPRLDQCSLNDQPAFVVIINHGNLEHMRLSPLQMACLLPKQAKTVSC
jgi:hypothetical protein